MILQFYSWLHAKRANLRRAWRGGGAGLLTLRRIIPCWGQLRKAQAKQQGGLARTRQRGSREQTKQRAIRDNQEEHMYVPYVVSSVICVAHGSAGLGNAYDVVLLRREAETKRFTVRSTVLID